MRRTVLIGGSAVAALVLVAGGWFAARAFTSPAQWEAQASAPAPRPVLAEVGQGDLVDVRTLGAVIVPRAQMHAVITPASDAERSIVTESPLTAGASVRAGTVLVRVNGHPVFALASTFPFYRDLGVGDSGPDVAALQRNLVELGLLSHADGEFGPATARAVAALYRAGNATAPRRATPAPEQPEQPKKEQSDAAHADVPDDTPGAASAASAQHPYLPLDAVVTVPALPVTASALPAVGADVAETATVSFAAPDAVLRLAVDAGMTDTLIPGATAECTVGAEAAAPCQVRRVFAATGSEAGLDGDEVMTWAELALTEVTIPSDRAGERATVRIEVATLATDALLVPASALAQQSDASGTVLRQDDDTFRTVRVDIIAALDGTLAVSGDLRPGDQLRVDR